MNLRLRPAQARDAYALWLWANDADTRTASHGRPPIPWAEHVHWLERQLAGADECTLIAECELEQPAGSVRFDTEDRWATARLSYVVAPEARGRGLSQQLVTEGARRIAQLHPGVRLRADVAPDNRRSLAVFRGLGWREEPPGDMIRFWLFTREP